MATIFKVGDRVKTYSHMLASPEYANREATIYNIVPGSAYPLRLKFDNGDTCQWLDEGDLKIIKKAKSKNIFTMAKYYRVKQDTFMWKAGAILTDQEKGEYVAIDDIWHTVDHDDYVSANLIEAKENGAFFERVYPDTLKGNLYRTKDQMLVMYQKAFQE